MKIYSIIIFGILLLFQPGCKKKQIDKRTKYIGTYDFNTTVTCEPHSYDCDTNYYYQGSIGYSNEKGRVTIKYNDYSMIEPRIDEDNSLIQYIDHYQDDSLGRFINNNEVEFVIRNGGKGGGNYYHVYGKKKHH